MLELLQDKLDYRHCHLRHFKSNKALGRVAQTAAVLGVVLGVHVCFGLMTLYRHVTGTPSDWDGTLMQWCAYMACLSAFHLLEYFATALNQDDALSDNSFVVNHSPAYTAAALASWAEFWLETGLGRAGYLPFSKMTTALVGLVMVLGGNAIRFHGMTSCGKNFSHLVMTERREDHKLVTTGIYSVLRHPAYFGWFYWSVGTQLLLGNPLCTLAYTVVSWRFFNSRIPFEESCLERFYGEDYAAYRSRTMVGIPLIH